jgi:PadR family transcriptional regulator, regulatory protein PadR
VRRTANAKKVATALLERPDVPHYGYDLRQRSGVRSGRLYPMLSRMLANGWLTDGWENPVPGRPPRRYYSLTPAGRDALRDLLDGKENPT